MIATRRSFLAATAAFGLLPTVGEAGGIKRLARFGAQSSDQWPLAPFSDDPDEYVTCSGDGVGFARGGRRKSLLFSRLQFTTGGQDFGVIASGNGNSDLVGYSPRPPDDYKPNALFYDQRNGDLHCFIARGTGSKGGSQLVNRRRAWLLTSHNRGRRWNVGDLPPLGRDPVFDAVPSGGLVPVGVCNRPGGSVHPDGYVYLYFNRQGNAKSFDLYPSSDRFRDRRPLYCGRIKIPRNLGNAQREAFVKNRRNYSFKTSRGWSSPGDMAAADPIMTPSHYMGKHFVAWWVPRLGRYVGAKTHSVHSVWLGVSEKPWGPFREALNERFGLTGQRDRLKFTAQLLPSPSIPDGNGGFFPLAISGAPYYDGFGLAKVKLG